MGYSKDFLKGLGWIGLFRIGAKLIVFAKVIVAYRFLSPREVGLFGLAAISLGLLEMLTETGINVVLIKDKRPLTYFLDTSFIVSIMRGIIISLFLFLLAFIAPPFFHDQGLFSLLVLVAIIPTIKGFINPAISAYVKNLQFDKEALMRIGLILVDAVSAILLVQHLHNAQSLIYAMILAAIAEVIYSYLWIRPWPRLRFNRQVYHEIIGPGKWINAVGIITYAEQNFDNIIVGRVLGSTALGFYQTAFNLTRSLIAEVGTAFSQVLLPIYGRLVDEPNRMKRAVFRLIVPAAGLMLIPTITLNLPSIQRVLIYLLKEKWSPSLELFLPLSICALITGMDTLVSPLFLARNWIRSLVVLYGIGLMAMLLLMWWFTHAYGLHGAAYAVLISRLLIQPLFIWQTMKVARAKMS